MTGEKECPRSPYVPGPRHHFRRRLLLLHIQVIMGENKFRKHIRGADVAKVDIIRRPCRVERVKEDGGEAGQFSTSETFGSDGGQHVLCN